MRVLSESLELTASAAGTSVKIISRAVTMTTQTATHAAQQFRESGTLILLTGLAPRSC